MIAVFLAVVASVAVIGLLILGDRARTVANAGIAPTAGWLSCLTGVLGAFAIAAPMIQSLFAPDGVDQLGHDAPWLFPASMVMGLVALVCGLYALVRRDRSWRMWVGLVAGALVTAFWLVFAAGELLFPH